MSSHRPVATISVDLDPVDVHLRGYGHTGLKPDPLVHRQGLDRLLDAFARHEVRATFFVLARDVPTEMDRLRDIAAAGHEVASHGIHHTPGLARQAESDTLDELVESRRRIEGAVGVPVVGFRAPDWSAGASVVSALDAAGYRYDASLVPSPVLTAGRLLLAIRARRIEDVAAVRLPPKLRREPFRWRVLDRSVVEFPLAVTPWLRVPLYHTLRPRMRDEAFTRRLDGFVQRGEPLSYALHGVDALGLVEDRVDTRLRHHPGMDAGLEAKSALIDATVMAIAERFRVETFSERLRQVESPDEPQVDPPA